MAETRPDLRIIMCAPRGFCAGVDRAIQIVELALQKYGAPVYVRHEIVHNRYVVEDLKSKGAVFVEELDEIPVTGQPVIFSAHGVAKSVPKEAAGRKMFYLDATCPLVSKVHNEAEHLWAQGVEIILIGHKGHAEVIGTMGQLPVGAVKLIETLQDAKDFIPQNPDALAFVTQTTLSVDDTAEIVATLKQRFPNMQAPRKEDICYATTNRQAAVKEIASRCDGLIVVGAPNSSNSQRLVDVAKRAGCHEAWLIQGAEDIDWARFETFSTLGITAGASAPEILVEEIIEALKQRFTVSIEIVTTADEAISFKLPRELRFDAAE